MKNWNLVEIGNSGLKIADGNYSAKYPNSSEFISEGVPFIRANNFKNKTIIDDELYFISSKKHSELKKGHLLPNDVLITTRGNIGQVALTPERHKCSNINAQIVLLRCNEFWVPKFLLYVLTIDFVTEQFLKLTTGTALKQLPVKNLKKIKIPLPPLPQQQKIANILDAADALRQNNKALIAKYDELTQALFLDMFGDPVRNPKGWDKIVLGKLTERIVVGHVGPTSNGYANSGIPFLRTQNVRINFINYKDILFVKQEFHDKLKKSKIYSHDILISRVGVNRGMAAVVPDDLHEANCANVIIVGSSSKFNSLYISFFLNKSFGTKPEYGYSVGSAQGVVNTSIVKKWPVFKVPIELQNKFAERITLIEEQKDIAQKSLERSEELFNSLLQKAFKGELV